MVALPKAPLGAEIDLAALPGPPTPERVRLGRWQNPYLDVKIEPLRVSPSEVEPAMFPR